MFSLMGPLWLGSKVNEGMLSRESLVESNISIYLLTHRLVEYFK